MYDKLAGMTGTAKTQLTEFEETYKLGVVEIPTNQPMVRDDQQDLIYKNEDAKWNAVVDDIVERNANGQPVLVGTVSIEKSETLSGYLNRRGVPHNVLNAKNHEKEATIVAQAGRIGAVTVATNMAGRGVDILLGGNPEYLARQEMAAAIWTTTAYLLFEMDEEERAAYEAEYEPIYTKFKTQTDAEHEEVVALGGLYVLGTERHESRRIDNQLRGRRTPGRPGRVAVLPLARGRPDADVRERPRQLDHGAPQVARRRGHHGEDGHARRRERPEADRGAQLRAPQERPEVRRRHEHPAQVIYDERTKILEGEDFRSKASRCSRSVAVRSVRQYCPRGHVPPRTGISRPCSRVDWASHLPDHECESLEGVRDAAELERFEGCRRRVLGQRSEVWLPR